MSILAAIASELKATTAVSDIVGTQIATARAARTHTVPYVVIQRIGQELQTQHQTARGDMVEAPTLQVDCYESTVALVEILKAAVIDALDHFTRGTIGNGANTATIRGLLYRGSSDEFISTRDKDPDGTVRRELEFEVAYV